jgi:hypothetical protein
MPLGEPMERIEIRRESELQRCLRIYRNDSLIAWHLGIPKAEVAKARAKLKPQRVYAWLNEKPIGMDEYEKRKADAKADSLRLAEAMKRALANG